MDYRPIWNFTGVSVAVWLSTCQSLERGDCWSTQYRNSGQVAVSFISSWKLPYWCHLIHLIRHATEQITAVQFRPVNTTNKEKRTKEISCTGLFLIKIYNSEINRRNEWCICIPLWDLYYRKVILWNGSINNNNQYFDMLVFNVYARTVCFGASIFGSLHSIYRFY